jgi:hypothetical protein
LILFDCSVVPVPGLPDDAVPVPAPMDDDMDSDDDLDARIYGKKADRIGNKTAEEEVATYLKEDPPEAVDARLVALETLYVSAAEPPCNGLFGHSRILHGLGA